jgi:DnaK suppressor protein
MDEQLARERLAAERTEVAQLLNDAESAGAANRAAEGEPGDYADSAQPLTAQGMDDAMADAFLNRLAAIDRALKRLDEGTYGLSIRSGQRIPDARLEADPAAELTIEEARAAR